MNDFKLDTSGEVRIYTNVGESGGSRKRDWRWTDLDPFTQGYIEAMLKSYSDKWTLNGVYAGTAEGCGFSDLAPETLARIMEDCANPPDSCPKRLGREAGAAFWNFRGREMMAGFGPLTAYLGDDGKVRFQ